MLLECLEQFDPLRLLEAACVKPEQAIGVCQSRDGRGVIPIEMKLNLRRLPLSAQVRTSAGRSLIPDSSTKTISLPSRWAFF